MPNFTTDFCSCTYPLQWCTDPHITCSIQVNPPPNPSEEGSRDATPSARRQLPPDTPSRHAMLPATRCFPPRDASRHATLSRHAMLPAMRPFPAMRCFPPCDPFPPCDASRHATLSRHAMRTARRYIPPCNTYGDTTTPGSSSKHYKHYLYGISFLSLTRNDLSALSRMSSLLSE